jgi:hypothetical protein
VFQGSSHGSPTPAGSRPSTAHTPTPPSSAKASPAGDGPAEQRPRRPATYSRASRPAAPAVGTLKSRARASLSPARAPAAGASSPVPPAPTVSTETPIPDAAAAAAAAMAAAAAAAATERKIYSPGRPVGPAHPANDDPAHAAHAATKSPLIGGASPPASQSRAGSAARSIAAAAASASSAPPRTASGGGLRVGRYIPWSRTSVRTLCCRATLGHFMASMQIHILHRSYASSLPVSVRACVHITCGPARKARGCSQDPAATGTSRAGSRPLIAAAPASFAAAVAASVPPHPEPDPDHEPSVSKLLLEPWTGARPASSGGGGGGLRSWDPTPHHLGSAASATRSTGGSSRAQTAAGGYAPLARRVIREYRRTIMHVVCMRLCEGVSEAKRVEFADELGAHAAFSSFESHALILIACSADVHPPHLPAGSTPASAPPAAIPTAEPVRRKQQVPPRRPPVVFGLIYFPRLPL